MVQRKCGVRKPEASYDGCHLMAMTLTSIVVLEMDKDKSLVFGRLSAADSNCMPRETL